MTRRNPEPNITFVGQLDMKKAMRLLIELYCKQEGYELDELVFKSDLVDKENNKVKYDELMCDSYCKWPGMCKSQDELDEHCDDCQMIKLWNYVNKGESD